MKKIDLKAIKTRPHLIAKFPHLFQPGGGFPHLDQILDLTLFVHVSCCSVTCMVSGVQLITVLETYNAHIENKAVEIYRRLREFIKVKW